MFKRLLLAAFCAAVLGLGALAVFWSLVADDLNSHLGKSDTLVVEPGSSLTRVVYRLANDGMLKHPRLVVYYLRLTGKTNLLAGEYQLAADLTTGELLDKLARGEVKRYQVTIVEGWTFKQALAHLHKQDALGRELVGLDDDAMLKALGVSEAYTHPEGLFFPDTYHYVKGMSEKDILGSAYQRMQMLLSQAWPNRAEGLPLENAYEALILSSIVERETGADAEREQIAGVFIQRMEKGMRLQTDPTVIYGLGEGFDGNLTRKHLKTHTPYNTYRIKGLPPTPIALPSRRSLHAALHPLKNGMLYFVARGDGSHQFSASLDEHNAAVKQYQLKARRQDYRSAPPP